MLVKSPASRGEAPARSGERARRRGIPVWSEVELGYRLLAEPGSSASPARTARRRRPSCSARSSGAAATCVAGNVGRPLTASTRRPGAGSSASCRASSSRTSHELACDVAVLLNLEPDHLDRHGTFEAYRDAKLRIFERPRTTRGRAARVRRVPGARRRVEFAADDPLPAEPLIPGAHNRENAAAATAAARAAGVADDAIAEALAHVPRRAAPARARRRAATASATSTTRRRRTSPPRAARSPRTRRAAAPDPRRLAQGRGLRAARRRDRPNVRARLPDRRGGRRARGGARPRRRPYERAATSRRRSRRGRRAASRATSSCSRPACASYDQFDDFEQRGEDVPAARAEPGPR